VKPLIPWFEVPILEIPIGSFTLPLHGFGMLVAIGFMVGSQVSMGRARRLGLDPNVINRLVGWLVAGTFVGGHVGYGLMYKPDEYLAHPVEFLYAWQGLSSFGGFAVCVPIAIWFFYKEKVNVWAYLDCLALGMTVGWFFGRMGCFVAHDHPGTVTNFWLGVYGICPGQGHNVACHDMGLYEGLWSLAMFAIFGLVDRRPLVPGTLVTALGLAYAPTRFMMDFLRPETNDARYGGLTPAQWFCIVLVFVAAGALGQRLRSGEPRLVPPGPQAEPKPA
jgi:phosphatidylglycerol:prolipoprotein diacylglycerol transferase